MNTTLRPWLTEFDFGQPLSEALQQKYASLKRQFQNAIDADALCIYWEPTPRGFRVPVVWPVRRLHGEYADTANGRRRWADKVARHQQDGEQIADPFTPMDADIQCVFGGWLNPSIVRVTELKRVTPELRYTVIANTLDRSMADYWLNDKHQRWRGDDTLCIHVECMNGVTFEYIIDRTQPPTLK